MPEQLPVVGAIVHFMYGGDHVPAVVTGYPIQKADDTELFLTVFLPTAPPFTTVAAYGGEIGPSAWNNATWHRMGAPEL